MLIKEALDLLDKSMIKLAGNITAKGVPADANTDSISTMADKVLQIEQVKDDGQKLVIIDEDNNHTPLIGGKFDVSHVGEFATIDGVAITGHLDAGTYIVKKMNPQDFPDYSTSAPYVRVTIQQGMTTILRYTSKALVKTTFHVNLVLGEDYPGAGPKKGDPVFGGYVRVEDAKGNMVAMILTGKDGKGSNQALKKLPEGYYNIRVWDRLKPAGFLSFSSVSVRVEGGTTDEYDTLEAKPDPAYKWGKIKVFLNGHNGPFPAGGAQIDVINASGYVVETLTTTSNKFNGVATSSYLPQGKYTVKLVKDAPGSDSSAVPDRVKTAEVTIDGTSEIVNAYLRTFKQLPLIVRITYAEANPEWGINAGDLITSDYAEFTVTDGTGAAVDYLSTDGGSAYGCKLLSAGDYTITAVYTPWGMLTPDPVTLSLSGMDTSAEITIPFHFDPASAASERRAK